MPKVELDAIEQVSRTGYPAPFDQPVAGRWYRRLAPAGGLTEMTASQVTLKPGGWSSQRHWHEGEDELVVMLSGEAVLIEDDGETMLRAGDIATSPRGCKTATTWSIAATPTRCSLRSARDGTRAEAIPTST